MFELCRSLSIIRSQIEKNVLLLVVRSPDAVGVAIRFCLGDYCC